MTKLSEYELEREANIARNKLLLQQLELKQAVDGLGMPKGKVVKSAAKPVQPAKKEKRKREEIDQPRRHSARLRKNVIDPNETPAKRRKREREEEAERQKVEEQRLSREEEARKASRPRHNKLDIIALVENGPEESSTLSKAMEAIPQGSTARVADYDAYVYDEKDSTEEEEAVSDLRERLNKLVVYGRAKVTKSRIYCAAYHPEVTKDLIFFGDKEGQLGIWDPRAPDEEDEEEGVMDENKECGKYWRMQLHWPANAKSSISSIKFDPIDAHNVYTSSYDSTVRALSFTTGVSREVFASDNLICCIDLAQSGHEMWLSDSEGWATHIDLRESKNNTRSFALSENKVGSISINPTNPHFLATASNSRVMRVWDVRKLDSIFLELSGESKSDSTTTDVNSGIVTEFNQSDKGRGTLRGEWRHDKSVTAAFWDARGRQIVSTSYDDNLRIWNLDPKGLKNEESFRSFRPSSGIRHNCQTGKWVTLLKAQWAQNPNVYPYFTIANMNHSVDIYSGKGQLLANLSDPRRITAVQAVTCSHPNIVERIATGNGSGRCVFWAPEDL
ncbi:WD40 repeat-like protein [Coprinopsis marcescibilis]|uniref:DNA damage-binding protein CMR1 n=1 Tax=Coprinopsis marcescibilis TaxID=230819 RepID=A0A5C3LB13_COPMA|nr:WD40 repeat-like protein [Coprinopsis marcescibilis]